MKPLNMIFVCGMVALNSVRTYGMEKDFKGLLRKISNTRTQTISYNPSFSTVLNGLYNKYLACFLRLGPANQTKYIGTEMRNLLYYDKSIGEISYTDFNNDTKHRYINHIGINAEYRAQGYGTYFMKRFIEQSQYDEVSTILLYALPKSRSFYLKHLGFSPRTPESSVLYKKITPLNHINPLATARDHLS